MRLRQPRLQPLTDDELSERQVEVLQTLAPRRRPLNLFRTALRAPEAMRRLLVWGDYVQSSANDLAPRERELVILRIAYLCRAGYCWAQHQSLATDAGLAAAEIARAKAGPSAAGWSDADRALLAACDELHAGQFIGEATWSALARFFSEKQRMDVVFTAGHYVQTAMILNTFGVQLDPGLTPDPDLALSGG